MSRVLEVLRRPTVFLAVGLIVSAASGSVFLLILNLALSSYDFIALSGLNILLAAISTGAMAGIAQEMVRAVSRAIARGLPTAPVIRRQVRQAGWIVGITLAGCLALSPVLTEHWLRGNWVLYAELMLGLIGAIVSFQVRGTLSGRQDFHVFSITLLVEAFTRMVPSVLLLAIGCHAAWLYGLMFALGPVLSAVTGIWLPKVWHRPHLEYPEATETSDADEESEGRAARNLGLLTGATLASQLLLNAVPLLVQARYQHAELRVADQAAAILSAVGLARLGIVALLPIQEPLLPKLTTAAEQGKFHDVRSRTLQLVGVCVVLGVAAVLVSATAGPWVLRDIMHAHAVLPNWFLAAFAAGTMFMMIAFILQAGLIAMNRHLSVMVGWALGVVVTIPIFMVAGDIKDVTAAGALVGPLVAALFLAVDLWWTMRRRSGAPGPAAPARARPAAWATGRTDGSIVPSSREPSGSSPNSSAVSISRSRGVRVTDRDEDHSRGWWIRTRVGSIRPTRAGWRRCLVVALSTA
jgi:O-antigen/teichoic acid export membrane protein